jgi:hypothetical protein
MSAISFSALRPVGAWRLGTSLIEGALFFNQFQFYSFITNSSIYINGQHNSDNLAFGIFTFLKQWSSYPFVSIP